MKYILEKMMVNIPKFKKHEAKETESHRYQQQPSSKNQQKSVIGDKGKGKVNMQRPEVGAMTYAQYMLDEQTKCTGETPLQCKAGVLECFLQDETVSNTPLKQGDAGVGAGSSGNNNTNLVNKESKGELEVSVKSFTNLVGAGKGNNYEKRNQVGKDPNMASDEELSQSPKDHCIRA
ncbi:hypothetical protein VNO78_02579 [Psophocarpus tetragonolobus]|uniref:Uncharacterized protein n=1 Tax=Psophocarpus tetragonolobus TaxID=3891 RepID=A0AAN9SYV3_PSOTE